MILQNVACAFAALAALPQTSSVVACAQGLADPGAATVERIAALGDLYGAVYYFHPDVAPYDSARRAWDDAVARAIQSLVREEGEDFRRILHVPPRESAASYSGETVMLIDERAVSQAEFTGMMFRAAAGTRFVGTPTAGANGDVTDFALPGRLRVSFTGTGIGFPDGERLQRRGLILDVYVEPTLAGLRAGRDEVLERALDLLRVDSNRPGR